MCPRREGGGVKNGKNSDHVVVECPFAFWVFSWKFYWTNDLPKKCIQKQFIKIGKARKIVLYKLAIYSPDPTMNSKFNFS